MPVTGEEREEQRQPRTQMAYCRNIMIDSLMWMFRGVVLVLFG